MNKILIFFLLLICLTGYSSCQGVSEFSFFENQPGFPYSSFDFDFKEDDFMSPPSAMWSSATSEFSSTGSADQAPSLPWLFHSLNKNPSLVDFFIARQPDADLIVDGNGIKVSSRGTVLLEMSLLDSNQPFPGQLIPQKRYGEAVTNYFMGSQPSDWHADLPLWEEVLVDDVYPLIDVLYYTDPSGQLEFDFLLEPGADPKLHLHCPIRTGD